MISFRGHAAQQWHMCIIAIETIVQNLYQLANFYRLILSSVISPTPSFRPAHTTSLLLSLTPAGGAQERGALLTCCVLQCISGLCFSRFGFYHNSAVTVLVWFVRYLVCRCLVLSVFLIRHLNDFKISLYLNYVII